MSANSYDAEPLLARLQQQLQTLAGDIAKTNNYAISQARFDQQLFNTQGKHLNNYYTEIEKNIAQLGFEVKAQRLTQVAFLAERIVMQISALQRELATLSLRRNDDTQAYRQTDGADIHQKLAQHQDYQRRLEDMIRDRESQLAKLSLLSEQRKLQQEIAAYEGRLDKCLAAIQRIERQIDRHDH